MSGPFAFLGLNVGSAGPGPMGGHTIPMAGPIQPGPMMPPPPPSPMLDPATNNAPLIFNTNKGKPPLAIPGGGEADRDCRINGGLGPGIGDLSPGMSGPEGGMQGQASMVGGNMMGSMGPMGFGPMMGGMPPSDPNLMMMGPMGFNQFGGFMGPGIGPGVGLPDHPPKEVIHLKDATLFPPPPGAQTPSTRERPPGCRTIFVGGLPETCTEETMREIFEQCGPICNIRLSKKNFAHVRFDIEEAVDKAIYLSGFRLRIGTNDDKPNTGRLHVDYAQARDDLYEWECKQRSLDREQRHRIRIEEERLRPPSPPPIIHFSDHEASVLIDKLKVDDNFMKASQILITWLDRGDCNRRTANTFYSMVQSTNSHVRRLMQEKTQYDEDYEIMKEKFKQRLQGIIHQFEQIERVFGASCKQKAWDHFTKAQRKNIDMWRKQAEEIKATQQEEFLKDRHEDEMEMSDSEDAVVIEPVQPAVKKFKVEQDLSIASQQWQQLREENDALKCQLEAYKNEVDLIKQENLNHSDDKDKQLKVLQQALQGMQQQLISLRSKQQEQQQQLSQQKRDDDVSKLVQDGDKSEEKSKENIKEVLSTSPAPSPIITTITVPQIIEKLNERQARLVGVISTFLHVHPFGASIDYIWSYLQRLQITIRTSEIEDLLESLPSVFKQDLHGVGASLEKRWLFIGFEGVNKLSVISLV